MLRPADIAICAASLAMLVIPTVGSVYPVPDAPVMYFPYIYLAYVAIGIAWVTGVHRRKPEASLAIRADLDAGHLIG